MPVRPALLASSAVAAVLLGCGGDVVPASPTGGASTVPDTTAAAAPAPTASPAPHLCRSTREADLGRIADPTLDELSGLTRGRRAGVLWGIEDSGNPAVLIAIPTSGGAPPAHVTVTGAENVDWEDVAASRRADGTPVLLIADIGDNAENRRAVRIYRVPEPGPTDAATAPAVARELVYPDGPHDAEALLADPLRRELVIVTKGVVRGRAYVVPRDGRTLRAGPRIALSFITAGSVSADGRIVALRSYSRLLLWARRGREPLERTLTRRPTCVARAAISDELQGESVALDTRGRTALAAPEGAEPRLQRFG